mgnify:CR=1
MVSFLETIILETIWPGRPPYLHQLRHEINGHNVLILKSNGLPAFLTKAKISYFGAGVCPIDGLFSIKSFRQLKQYE